MTSKEKSASAGTNAAEPEQHPAKTLLSPEAERALAEAQQRQRSRENSAQPAATEIGGPKGLEPTRYGDWERKGIASDF